MGDFNQIEELEREIQATNRILKEMPEGRLNCWFGRGRLQCYQATGSKLNGTYTLKYLPKSEIRLIEDLALKKFFTARLQDLNFEKMALLKYDKYISKANAVEQLAISSPAMCKVFASAFAVEDDTALQWESADYSSSAGYEEGKNVPTLKGIYVRSKSEGSISDDLTVRGIPFRYEQDIVLAGRRYNTDFNILHPIEKREIKWEHLGLLGDADYRDKNADKIQRYIKEGYLPGYNLILTSETENHPFSFADADRVIQLYFGDYGRERLENRYKGKNAVRGFDYRK